MSVSELLHVGDAEVDSHARGKEFRDFVLLLQHLTERKTKHQVLGFHFFGDFVGHFHIRFVAILDARNRFTSSRIDLHVVDALYNFGIFFREFIVPRPAVPCPAVWKYILDHQVLLHAEEDAFLQGLDGHQVALFQRIVGVAIGRAGVVQ